MWRETDKWMATQAPADGDRVGAAAVPGGVSSSGDDDGAGAAPKGA